MTIKKMRVIIVTICALIPNVGRSSRINFCASSLKVAKLTEKFALPPTALYSSPKNWKA